MTFVKKLAVIILAVAMVMSLAVTTYAADTVSIKVEKAIDGATYQGYCLLTTTTSLKNENCHVNDAEHLSSCYNIAYAVNEKYLSALTNAAGSGVDSGNIIDYIASLTDAEAIRGFADQVYESIKNMGADATATGANAEATFADVASGYWLIVESIADSTYAGAYSLVMLDTIGSRDITISTKRDEPVLHKYVRDNGMSYGKGADMQIGDNAEFLLIADVPSPSGYDTYKYSIHDQMSAGLTYDVTKGVEIRTNTVDGAILENTYYTVDQNPTCDKKCSIHITVKIKEATNAGVLKGDDRLYISYEAKLNEKANILVTGENVNNANPNTAWLEYSNDPYNETKTAVCAQSVVYVWTFPLELRKVDGSDVSLSGAKFVLSTKGNLAGLVSKTTNELDESKKGNLLRFRKITGTDGVVHYLIVPADYTGTDTVYEIEAGTVKIDGFDDQVEYYLYETKAPDGYKELSNPVSLKFFASYVSSEDARVAQGYPMLSVNTAPESSSLTAKIVNQTGAELPSTGGIGTTIFYILGGVMVLGAVVLLITKKRMAAEE